MYVNGICNRIYGFSIHKYRLWIWAEGRPVVWFGLHFFVTSFLSFIISRFRTSYGGQEWFCGGQTDLIHVKTPGFCPNEVPGLVGGVWAVSGISRSSAEWSALSDSMSSEFSVASSRR